MLSLIVILTMDCISQVDYTGYIEKRMDYFSEYLSSFPPNVKDSIEASNYKRQLISFMDTVRNLRRDGYLRNDKQYYLWMGELNSYGYNLNIPGAWDESEIFYNNVLKIDSKSTKAKMALSSLYANNWSPEDKKTYKNLYHGYNLLFEIYRECKNIHNPTLYHNMLIFSVYLHSKAICYDAIFKHAKYFPNDTNDNIFKGAISPIKDSCIEMKRENNIITYENKFAKYRVSYPDDFLLFKENSNQDGDGIQCLMIETPLTATKNKDSITNSISITATPINIANAVELTNQFITRGGMIKDSSRIAFNNIESFFFTSRYGQPEKYKGIYSIYQNNHHTFQMIYIATVSTYDKNLKSYFDFEKSFTAF